MIQIMVHPDLSSVSVKQSADVWTADVMTAIERCAAGRYIGYTNIVTFEPSGCLCVFRMQRDSLRNNVLRCFSTITTIHANGGSSMLLYKLLSFQFQRRSCSRHVYSPRTVALPLCVLMDDIFDLVHGLRVVQYFQGVFFFL